MENMKKIAYLKTISAVSGKHDLIMYVNVPSPEILFEVIHKIQCEPMIKSTSTHVIEQEIQIALS